MKKNTTAKTNQETTRRETTNQAKKNDPKKNRIHELAGKQRLTIGLDLGDRTTRYCILDERGEIVSEDRLATTKEGFDSLLEKMPRSRVALEVGTHSPWVSAQIASLGHEVIVANPHKVKLITQSTKKNDRIDAERLARLARVDPKLLSPIRHRGTQAQADLAVIRARAELMEARTALINSARGLAKPMGERLAKCDADQVKESLASGTRAEVREVIGPILKSVEAISQQIAEYDKKIEKITARYPETEVLRQVHGVGPLIALGFILTLEDAQRFQQSREVGPYLGLTPKQHESGDSSPELAISKAGDGLLRSLLVQGAHCILRRNAPDSDLKAWGLRMQENKAGKNGGRKGGKTRKKKAVVAVARKLAVLLHRLWVTGEVYDPHYNSKSVQAAKAQRKAA
jgi:transposase